MENSPIGENDFDIFSEHLSGCFRQFSPDYVRVRILSSLTEVLQRARRYDDAIDLIQYLLGMNICFSHL